MARPRKWRRVCSLPLNTDFGPTASNNSLPRTVTMSVDEFETIRLMDLERLTQENCAEQMGIARTTVQRIYEDARRKLADSLVNGASLHIEGGDFRICGEDERPCGRSGCGRHGYHGGSREQNGHRGIGRENGQD